MVLDSVIKSRNLNFAVENFNGLCRFKQRFSDWFEDDSTVFIRKVGKRSVGYWRILPNKTTEFYRCPKVDINDQAEISEIYAEAIYSDR